MVFFNFLQCQSFSISEYMYELFTRLYEKLNQSSGFFLCFIYQFFNTLSHVHVLFENKSEAFNRKF